MAEGAVLTVETQLQPRENASADGSCCVQELFVKVQLLDTYLGCLVRCKVWYVADGEP